MSVLECWSFHVLPLEFSTNKAQLLQETLARCHTMLRQRVLEVLLINNPVAALQCKHYKGWYAYVNLLLRNKYVFIARSNNTADILI